MRERVESVVEDARPASGRARSRCTSTRRSRRSPTRGLRADRVEPRHERPPVRAGRRSSSARSSATATSGCAVEDGGAGVPAEFVPNLFERFTREPNDASTASPAERARARDRALVRERPRRRSRLRAREAAEPASSSSLPVEPCRRTARTTGAGERTRTSKGLAAHRDLNPARLPVPPRPRMEKRSGVVSRSRGALLTQQAEARAAGTRVVVGHVARGALRVARGEPGTAARRADAAARAARAASSQTPASRDLSKRDWKAILVRAGKEAKEDGITDVAAMLAYYAFLSIPAVLLVTLGLFTVLAGRTRSTRSSTRSRGSSRPRRSSSSTRA